MNEATVYRYIADRLDRMTDEQLDAVRRDCLFTLEQVANGAEVLDRGLLDERFWPFNDDGEDRLAEDLRRNPHELQRLRTVLAEHEQPPRKKKDPHEYLGETCASRDEAETRWEAVREGIAKAQFPECHPRDKLIDCAELPRAPGARVAELIAYAEHYAGTEHLGHVWHKVQDVYLRKQKIYTLASFMARLSDPMAGTADPLEAA
jgi:hypothetical protein